jgi:hypothetical protein
MQPKSSRGGAQPRFRSRPSGLCCDCIGKIFYRPDVLTERLTAWGWQARIEQTPTYFYCGLAGKPPPSEV